MDNAKLESKLEKKRLLLEAELRIIKHEQAERKGIEDKQEQIRRLEQQIKDARPKGMLTKLKEKSEKIKTSSLFQDIVAAGDRANKQAAADLEGGLFKNKRR